jgi:hypothetical protein
MHIEIVLEAEMARSILRAPLYYATTIAIGYLLFTSWVMTHPGRPHSWFWWCALITGTTICYYYILQSHLQRRLPVGGLYLLMLLCAEMMYAESMFQFFVAGGSNAFCLLLFLLGGLVSGLTRRLYELEHGLAARL